VSLGFCIVLDTSGRLAGLVVKVWSACEEFEANEGGVLVLRVLVPAHQIVS